MSPATPAGISDSSRASILARLKNTTVRFRTTTVLVVFFCVYACLQYRSISYKSGTYDEPIHLTAGYLALAHQDFRIDATHPPLLRMWAALPLLFRDDVQADVAVVHSWPYQTYLPESYKYASKFAYPPDGDEFRLLAGRAMIALVGALLGLLLFFAARDWLGVGPATFVLGLYLIEPNLSAHAGLVTTDIGAACFFFGAVYFLWKTLRRWTAPNVAGTALFFSLAIASKFSAVLLVPIFAALTLAAVVRQKSIAPRQAFLLAGIVVAAGWLAIWAVYGFRHAPTAISNFQWQVDTYFSTPKPETWMTATCNWIDRHRLLPNAFIQGFAISIAHAQVVPSYFAGQINNTGWWYYFPAAFLMKTPTSMLILLGWTAYAAVRRRKSLPCFVAAAGGLAAVVYFAAAVFSNINIGLRHILPVYPFALLLLGIVVHDIARSPRWKTAKAGALGLLALWWCATFVHIYPDTLTFFNRLVGGPEHGRRFLTDSNIDWGQHLKPLGEWMGEHAVARINLAYFGTADPAFYGVDQVSLPANMSMVAGPASKPDLPGYVAISETLMSGVYWSAEGKILYDGFKDLKPVAVLGNTIRLYRVEKWPMPRAADLLDRTKTKIQNLVSLADYLVHLKWPGQAMSYYRMVLELEPSNAAVHAKIGTLHLHAGDRPAATRSYRQALALAPDSAKYTGMLACLLVEQGLVAEARPHALRWVQLSPESSEAHYCLGAIFVEDGEYLRARAELAEALRLAPDNRQVAAELKRLDDALRKAR